MNDRAQQYADELMKMYGKSKDVQSTHRNKQGTDFPPAPPPQKREERVEPAALPADPPVRAGGRNAPVRSAPERSDPPPLAAERTETLPESEPEAEETEESVTAQEIYPDKGTLVVETTSAREALPVGGALVTITRGTELYGLLRTDESGRTARLELGAPPKENSESFEAEGEVYAAYDAEIYADGYYAVKKVGIPVFADTEVMLPVNMIPLPEASAQREITFYD